MGARRCVSALVIQDQAALTPSFGHGQRQPQSLQNESAEEVWCDPELGLGGASVQNLRRTGSPEWQDWR